MSIYYFHLKDGSPDGETAGIELPDLDSARRLAETYFNAVISESGTPPDDGSDWQMRVTDETGRVWYSFDLAAAGATAGRIRAYRERAESAFPEHPARAAR